MTKKKKRSYVQAKIKRYWLCRPCYESRHLIKPLMLDQRITGACVLCGKTGNSFIYSANIKKLIPHLAD